MKLLLFVSEFIVFEVSPFIFFSFVFVFLVLFHPKLEQLVSIYTSSSIHVSLKYMLSFFYIVPFLVLFSKKSITNLKLCKFAVLWPDDNRSHKLILSLLLFLLFFSLRTGVEDLKGRRYYTLILISPYSGILGKIF